MARYYFHLCEGGKRIEDTEGMDLPCLEAARDFAVKNARMIISHEVNDRGAIALDDAIEIADQTGRTARTVTFREAVWFS